MTTKDTTSGGFGTDTSMSLCEHLHSMLVNSLETMLLQTSSSASIKQLFFQKKFLLRSIRVPYTKGLVNHPGNCVRNVFVHHIASAVLLSADPHFR